MTHYVLLKLAPGVDVDAAEQRVRATYEALDVALPYVHNARVYRNCVARDSNYDLMVSIELDAEEDLPKYLNHPLHMRNAQTMADQVAGRMSFDHQ